MSANSPHDLANILPLVGRGKVRDIYQLTDSTLLFVTTDKISAYDIVMENTVDDKGAVLTRLSEFWFTLLQEKIPTLNTHFISAGIPSTLEQRLPSEMAPKLAPRSMVVKRLKVLPIESIVRGYLSGSAWNSYRETGTVCGIALPAGLRESERLRDPLWTPSTKAEIGAADENINPAKAAEIIGESYAKQIEALSLQIYKEASAYGAQRGLIIADTKFEFGLNEDTTPPSIVLIDEVLTPDSSRFWSADQYAVGRGQDSFDKQHLRDWLVRTGQKGKSVKMPEEVVTKTIDRYKEAYRILAGKEWTDE